MGHRGIHFLVFLAEGVLLPVAHAGAASLGPPACHLGGCSADSEGGGGGALSLLQAEGAKAAAIRRRPPQQEIVSKPEEEGEAEPFATLLQVHRETLETVRRLSMSSRARNIFSAMVILPVLGFIATMLAIVATVVVEQRASTVQAQRMDAGPGRPAFSPHSDVLLGPGNVYQSMRRVLYGEKPPPMAPRSGPTSAAEALLQQPPPLGSRGGASFSPSFGEHYGVQPPLFPADKGEGQPIDVMVPQPLENGRLGLKLTDDALEITGFSDERARRFGFRLGDRILKVNGITVSDEQNFIQEVKRAIDLNRTQGQPLIFTVVHQGPPMAPAVQTPTPSMHLQPQTLVEGVGMQATDMLPPTARSPAPFASSPRDAPRAAGSSSIAKGTAMLGSWGYTDDNGGYSYHLKRSEASSGLLLDFSQSVQGVGLVTGTLSPSPSGTRGPGWYEGRLSANGYHYGHICLCYDAETGEMISLLKMQGDNTFGEEVRSQRQQGPTSSLSPLATAPPDTSMKLPFASVSTSPASLQAYDRSVLPSQQGLTLPEIS